MTTVVGTAIAVVLALCGYAVMSGNGATGPDAPAPSETRTADAPATGTTAASPSGRDAGVPGAAEARALLAALPVKGSAPATGYDRVGDFGEAWLDVDGNGCSTRDDILARDLSDVVRRDACTVVSGTLDDPYTGTRIAFERGVDTSARVQIDHVVPLLDAWRTGAQRLTPEARERLANDPLNLVAVDGPTNQRKGAGNAATWLPPAKSYRCTYASRQVAVKAEYGLWVVPAERAALQRILARC
ncbi:HNH endonuclease family protein [Leifsonia sp. LS1]|uniref:HNH endonuclease family protein n=1 Tax=Leifsonia sp. LS1 TaxID=2828483 RepID=UPI001CFDFD4B|nr:HNH endonuclease family protein [Leifsonia sp. LS1]